MKVIFLHGFAADKHVWKSYESSIENAEFFNIHFDENSKPVLPEITENTILVGWSMGGMVALEILKQQAEQIKGLVLLASSPTYVSSSLFPEGKTVESVKELRDAIVNYDKKALQNFQRQIFGKNDIKKGFLRKFRKEIGGLIHLHHNDLIRSLNFLEQYNPESIPKTDIPVIALHGSEDIIVSPASLESWLKIFPNAQTELVNCGHAIPFTEKDLVIEKIRLLLT